MEQEPWFEPLLGKDCHHQNIINAAIERVQHSVKANYSGVKITK